MRTQLFVMAALLTLAAGCDSSRQGGLGESRASQEGEVPVDETTPDVPGDGDSCVAETCFPLSSLDHAISFVAIDGMACDGSELELTLFDADGAPMDVDSVLHGNGKSCEGLASTARKFELGGEHHDVTLCVAGGAGDVTLAVKASNSCELTTVAADCDCDETGGTGGADTVGTGTGGSDGSGGAPPGDDTTVTVGVSVGVGTGGSDGGTGGGDGGTGGSDGGTGGSDDGTGGEGGCGGEDSWGDDGESTASVTPPS